MHFLLNNDDNCNEIGNKIKKKVFIWISNEIKNNLQQKKEENSINIVIIVLLSDKIKR